MIDLDVYRERVNQHLQIVLSGNDTPARLAERDALCRARRRQARAPMSRSPRRRCDGRTASTGPTAPHVRSN
ncbi:MAG: hypothetical protein U5O39_02385 [Gammaproteobacteria bacterium]|nr:hypothetical protein [Gammaproteobacteria bacterium]